LEYRHQPVFSGVDTDLKSRLLPVLYAHQQANLSMKPSRINVSIGTTAVLGLADVPMAVAPTTAYLMLGGRCLMNCAFCAQARESQAGTLRLSRVTWPEYDLDTVVDCLAGAAARGDVRRACLQVTVSADAFAHTLALLRAVKEESDLPFDVAILPQDLDQVRQLLDAGADHVGFGLDAACERVFRRVKGGSWKRSLDMIRESAATFPGRAALHLIVGLGETEHDMVERIQWAHDLGVTVGLFAFTPVRGSHLAGLPPPSLSSYRRIQAACWLIVHGLSRVETMVFNGTGQLLDLGGTLPATGEPFQTSGCPDCNRPYYNERPGGVIYNYPRPLAAGEALRAIQEMEIEVGC
jgi:biotin synthase-related radical SAM superfamily protein